MEETEGQIIYEIEEQRPGNNRNTKINKKHILGPAYRKKFDTISDDPKLNRLLYQLAKRMLKHRSGTTFEDMYWISPETGKVVAQEIHSPVERVIQYSRRTRKAILQQSNLITIHSHPDSHPPSIEDFNSNCANGYAVGIVACHDGTLYLYQSNEIIGNNYYQSAIAEFKRYGYNECMAQIKALEDLKRNFDIDFKEVTY